MALKSINATTSTAIDVLVHVHNVKIAVDFITTYESCPQPAPECPAIFASCGLWSDSKCALSRKKKFICLENMSASQFAILMIPSSARSPFYFHSIRPQRMIIIICLNYIISLINIFHHLSLPSVIIIITIKCLNQTRREKKA